MNGKVIKPGRKIGQSFGLGFGKLNLLSFWSEDI